MKLRRTALGCIILAAVMLALSVPALAGTTVTAKGRPAGARRLADPVSLPGGQTSSLTFSVRKSDGHRVIGYVVSGTRFYSSFNLGPYCRVTRGQAFREFHSPFTVKGKLVYVRQVAGGHVHCVLRRVYCMGIGE